MSKQFWMGLLGLAVTSPVFAGGAWVPAPGHGDVQLGFSRKTAHTSWNSRGEGFTNTTTRPEGVLKHYHDFRYRYASGEVGVFDRLSFRFLVTYLEGYEGPKDDLELNTGFSDAWLGVKYQLKEGAWPMAIAATLRTPVLYDIPGPYQRYLYNSDGSFRGLSPEWRGVLKEDYTFTYLLSHSYAEGRGWMNFELGYTFRNGAPADEVPFSFDIGYPLPFWNAAIKGSATVIQSVGNDSPRQPDDRFGSRPGFNFNNASHGRAGIALIVPLGKSGHWTGELGYNQWLFGRSARQYEEPYASLGYRF